MTVLVTGATGLVGKELVKSLLNDGFHVNYLTTRKSKIEQSKNHTGFYWNPESGEIDKSAFIGVSTIINLAGSSIAQFWNKKNKKSILDSRIKSLRLIYKSIKENKFEVKKLISASAIGIYPNSLNEIYTEDYHNESPTNFLQEVTKLWEQEADVFQDLDMDVVKVRIGLVLSKKGGVLEKLTTPIKYYLGSPLGTGSQWQSWIHITDLVNVFKFLVTKNFTGIFNAVAPNPISNSLLTYTIANHISKKVLLPKVPSFVLKLILNEMSILVLEGQNVSSEKLEKLDFVFKYNHLEPALQNLLPKKK